MYRRTMKDRAIIFFTRIPTYAKTKTRLETFLDRASCVELQTVFIKDIYHMLKKIGIDIIVCYSNHGELQMLKDLIGDHVLFIEQKGADLGEKMFNAIEFTLNDYKQVVLIGSDLPLMEEKDIQIAFEILEKKDVAISPTYDGGYYLIGMKEAIKEIFMMTYSTNRVFEETIEKIKKLNKTFGIGNIQLDIDTKDDFLELYQILEKNKDLACTQTRGFVDKTMKKSGGNE